METRAFWSRIGDYLTKNKRLTLSESGIGQGLLVSSLEYGHKKQLIMALVWYRVRISEFWLHMSTQKLWSTHPYPFPRHLSHYFSLLSPSSRTSGQTAKYNSIWWRAVLNFGPLWRGISVGSDAL